MLKQLPDLAQNKALYAKLGQTITDPQALSKWRRDPKAYHAEHRNARRGAKDTDYDEQMFNELMMAWDQQPENQMQRIFAELVRQAEKAYRITLNQSQATFIAGITIVVVTFLAEAAYLVGLLPGVKWEQALAGGGVLGGLGIGSIVSIFVRGPQSTISNALGDLAQIEVAFLSFINQTRGFDWSVAKTLDDVERLSTLIGRLRGETMADIQKYLEKEPGEVPKKKGG